MPRIFLDIGPLRRFPQFRRLWLGYAYRNFGAQMTIATVIYQVYDITHSNLDVGLISVAQVIPGVISPIFGGAVADAMDRRKLLMITAVLIAASTTGLALNSLHNHPALWVLYVCSATTWAMNGVDGPTRVAVLMTLVDRDSYIQANVLRQFLQQSAQIGGPAIAGVLIAIFSKNIDAVYWIDVLSSVVALQTLLRLPKLAPVGGGRRVSLQSIAEGFQYMVSKKMILGCFVTDINATLLGLPTSLFPYLALHHFHGGAKTYGLLTAAPAMGALFGGIISGWTARIRYQGRAVLVAVIIWGIAIAAFGFAPWLSVGIVLLAIAGWADAVSQTMRSTIIQFETPDRLRGRLSALNTMSVQFGKLGNAEAGIVAALSTAQISVVSGGLGCILGVFAVWKLIPSFPKYQMDKRQDQTLAEQLKPEAPEAPATESPRLQ